jgi:hypothetical protein
MQKAFNVSKIVEEEKEEDKDEEEEFEVDVRWSHFVTFIYLAASSPERARMYETAVCHCTKRNRFNGRFSAVFT